MVKVNVVLLLKYKNNSIINIFNEIILENVIQKHIKTKITK